jgi:hypothetical protein
MSWSSPLVARIGAVGWPSKQLTYQTKKKLIVKTVTIKSRTIKSSIENNEYLTTPDSSPR